MVCTTTAQDTRTLLKTVLPVSVSLTSKPWTPPRPRKPSHITGRVSKAQSERPHQELFQLAATLEGGASDPNITGGEAEDVGRSIPTGNEPSVSSVIIVRKKKIMHNPFCHACLLTDNIEHICNFVKLGVKISMPLSNITYVVYVFHLFGVSLLREKRSLWPTRIFRKFSGKTANFYLQLNTHSRYFLFLSEQTSST
jgi:hypothetical protein